MTPRQHAERAGELVLRKTFHLSGYLVLLACHWRLRLWRAPWFWLSILPLRDANGDLFGFTSLWIGCEFAVLRLRSADEDDRNTLIDGKTKAAGG